MPTVTNNITVSAVGASVLNTASPSAVSWIRVNADNTITYRTAAQTLSDLGAQAAGTYLVPADIGVTVQGYNANTTILGNSTTGSGSIVLATSPTIATSLILDYGTASTVVYLNASKQLISLANGTGVLTNNGSGTLTWAASSSGITVGTTTITSGTSTRVAFNDGGVYGEDADLTWNKTTNILTATGGFSTGTLTFKQTTINNIIIGGTTSTNPSTIVISSTGIGASACDGGVIIGEKAGIGGTVGNFATLVGFGACRFTATGVGGIGIGRDASPAHDGSIVIAYNATTTATHQGILGAPTASGYISNWYFNGVTHTAPYSTALRASGGSGTNINGANMTLSGGAATGTGNGGYVKATTSVKIASGTTVQSDTDRNVIVGKYVDITESAATTYGTLALTTSGTIAGGTIIYTIEANDGTDYQSLTGNAVYSVVNKAGTLTVTLTDLTQALAESAGGSTLTSTMTATVSGTSVLFQANAVSSLVQTTLRISFQVLNNFGVAIISPA